MPYSPGIVPTSYDPNFLYEELQRISRSISEIERAYIVLSPQTAEPLRKKEGMVINADGVNWNPGGGAGLYQYLSGAWVKL